MEESDFKAKLAQLKEAKDKNKIQFKWQDAVLAIVQDFGLPRHVQTSPDKKPLDVRGVLMRHAKRDLNLVQRRFAAVKESGKYGDDAMLYYLGIVEHENNK